MPNTTTYRFASGANQDTTYRTLNYEINTVGSGIRMSGITGSFNTSAYHTVVNLGTLTQSTGLACSGLTGSSPAYIGDKMDVYITGAATTYSVVFDSTFKIPSSNTVSIGTNANAVGRFLYNGTYWVGSVTSA